MYLDWKYLIGRCPLTAWVITPFKVSLILTRQQNYEEVKRTIIFTVFLGLKLRREHSSPEMVRRQSYQPHYLGNSLSYFVESQKLLLTVRMIGLSENSQQKISKITWQYNLSDWELWNCVLVSPVLEIQTRIVKMTWLWVTLGMNSSAQASSNWHITTCQFATHLRRPYGIFVHWHLSHILHVLHQFFMSYWTI